MPSSHNSTGALQRKYSGFLVVIRDAKQPLTFEEISAKSELCMATVQRYARVASGHSFIRPVGVRENGNTGTKPMQWEWV